VVASAGRPIDYSFFMLNHPNRVWPLTGATNFRDLGGYTGQDGRTVRWRRLFRSDHLGHLTADDQAMLEPLGVAWVFDFRGEAERAPTPSRMPGAVTLGLPIEPTVVQSMQSIGARGELLTAETTVALMKGLNRALVKRHAHRFAELFDHLLRAQAPLVFHCTAGKDRTGLAAALILLALGVSREVVMQDYLLTNSVYKRPAGLLSSWPEAATAMLWTVQASYLETALEVIDRDHGGVDAFLAGPMGLSPDGRAALQARYLEA
jgi:protein-tyrosine phosphatase